MSISRPTRTLERHSVSLGVGLNAACGALILATVWLLPASTASRVTLAALAVGAVVVAVGLSQLPWSRLPPHALLVFPVLSVSAITISALLTTQLTGAYMGFFTVALFYVASTQSERISMLAIPVALPLWVVCQGGVSSVVAVRLPITATVWFLIAHGLVRRNSSNQSHIDRLVLKAATDPLTGLSSRGELFTALEASSPGDALILLDLDDFKEINDTEGHQVGDEILAAFGASLRDMLRASDHAIRYGGDEVMLVIERAGREGADSLLERLHIHWGRPERPTFSAGVAIRGSEDPHETLRLADMALYEAKRAGRNCWAHAPTRPQLTVVQ